MVVLLLAGILSVTAFSRQTTIDDFAPALFVQAFSERYRYARLTASGRSNDHISLELSSSQAGWTISVIDQAGLVVPDTLLERASSTLTIGDGSYSTVFAPGSVFRISFDSLGGLGTAQVNAAALTIENGVQLSVAGATNRLLCLYPSGYLSEAPCS